MAAGGIAQLAKDPKHKRILKLLAERERARETTHFQNLAATFRNTGIKMADILDFFKDLSEIEIDGVAVGHITGTDFHTRRFHWNFDCRDIGAAGLGKFKGAPKKLLKSFAVSPPVVDPELASSGPAKIIITHGNTRIETDAANLKEVMAALSKLSQ